MTDPDLGTVITERCQLINFAGSRTSSSSVAIRAYPAIVLRTSALARGTLPRCARPMARSSAML
ncbi:hypothetical protein [Nocardia sp. NPDC057440]|uniref:hypothetical protein n=1 Tax=Nocardia sp. NPDC057440 TaxID=3346134 RepID=UPI0036721F11